MYAVRFLLTLHCCPLCILLLFVHEIIALRVQAGKTCLIDRLVHERFLGPTSSTVGAAFNAFDVPLDPRGAKKLTLGIWDTAGSDRFESLTKLYYKDAAAALVCYDLTDADSFERAKAWVQRVTETEAACLIVIIGTKLDLVDAGGSPRGVPLSQARAYAASINAQYFECSAKLEDQLPGGCRIGEPFEWVARAVAAKKDAKSTAGAGGAAGGAGTGGAGAGAQGGAAGQRAGATAVRLDSAGERSRGPCC